MSQYGVRLMTDCEERVDRLEAKVEKLESRLDTTDGRVKHVLVPRMEDLEESRDDAREQLAELGAMLQDMQNEFAQLQSRMRGLTGVEEKSESTPEQRVRDLRDAMIKRADARGESGSYYRIQLWREEVEDILADRGHGSWSKPVYQDAMKEVADEPGFEMDKKVNEDGREVDAVAVDTEELRAVLGRSDSTTGNPVTPGQIGGGSLIETTQD